MNIMESKKSNEEYAKHYPVVKQDGYFGPVVVGNLGQYNDRDIINLCLKTTRSNDRNSSISFPRSWGKASAFMPGDLVNVVVEDGYIKKIIHAKPKPVSFSAINREIAEIVEKSNAQASVEVAKKESQPVPAESTPF